MGEVVFAIPGDLDTPTGGYAYDRRLIDLLPRLGVPIRHLALPNGYPHPSRADLAETAHLIAKLPGDAILLIDGLAYGAMPADLVAGFDRPIVALVHHPLGLEHGLSPERQAELLAGEAQALALARHVIVTSPVTGRLLSADFNVGPARITVAEPGTEPAPRARGTGAPPHILAVGAISPRKGFDILVEALKRLAGLPWQATVAGATDRMPKTTAALRSAIAAAGLETRIVLTGGLGPAALEERYASADIFVSSSLYEGYGMVLAEALAHGLPLVASTGGAAAETVPDAAALKVPPADAAALSGALRRMITDPDLRARLGDASWAAGQALPRWSETAARVANALRKVRP